MQLAKALAVICILFSAAYVITASDDSDEYDSNISNDQSNAFLFYFIFCEKNA
jgi:hypothetical protein